MYEGLGKMVRSSFDGKIEWEEQFSRQKCVQKGKSSLNIVGVLEKLLLCKTFKALSEPRSYSTSPLYKLLPNTACLQ